MQQFRLAPSLPVATTGVAPPDRVSLDVVDFPSILSLVSTPSVFSPAFVLLAAPPAFTSAFSLPDRAAAAPSFDAAADWSSSPLI